MADFIKQLAIAVAPRVAEALIDEAQRRLRAREREEDPARPGSFAAYVQLRRARG